MVASPYGLPMQSMRCPRHIFAAHYGHVNSSLQTSLYGKPNILKRFFHVLFLFFRLSISERTDLVFTCRRCCQNYVQVRLQPHRPRAFRRWGLSVARSVETRVRGRNEILCRISVSLFTSRLKLSLERDTLRSSRPTNYAYDERSMNNK